MLRDMGAGEDIMNMRTADCGLQGKSRWDGVHNIM